MNPNELGVEEHGVFNKERITCFLVDNVALVHLFHQLVAFPSLVVCLIEASSSTFCLWFKIGMLLLLLLISASFFHTVNSIICTVMY